MTRWNYINTHVYSPHKCRTYIQHPLLYLPRQHRGEKRPIINSLQAVFAASCIALFSLLTHANRHTQGLIPRFLSGSLPLTRLHQTRSAYAPTLTNTMCGRRQINSIISLQTENWDPRPLALKEVDFLPTEDLVLCLIVSCPPFAQTLIHFSSCGGLIVLVNSQPREKRASGSTRTPRMSSHGSGCCIIKRVPPAQRQEDGVICSAALAGLSKRLCSMTSRFYHFFFMLQLLLVYSSKPIV